MGMHKYIYWRNDLEKNTKGERFANIHVLVGYNGGYISDYINMAKVISKDFPNATWDNIVCGKVRKSERVQGFSIINFSTYLPEGKYPGWTQTEKGPEYYW